MDSNSFVTKKQAKAAAKLLRQRDKQQLQQVKAKLVEEVRRRQAIWNKKTEGHRDRELVDAAWDEVAVAMKQPKDDVKARWKVLLDQFRVLLNAATDKRSGSDEAVPFDAIKWPFFKRMLFLRDSVSRRSTTSNVSFYLKVVKSELQEPEDFYAVQSNSEDSQVSTILPDVDDERFNAIAVKLEPAVVESPEETRPSSPVATILPVIEDEHLHAVASEPAVVPSPAPLRPSSPAAASPPEIEDESLHTVKSEPAVVPSPAETRTCLTTSSRRSDGETRRATSSTTATSRCTKRKRKRKSKQDTVEEALETNLDRLERELREPDDAAAKFANYVAEKLRGIDEGARSKLELDILNLIVEYETRSSKDTIE